MAIIKETNTDFTLLGTPSTGEFYLGFDLDGSLKYKNPSGDVITPGSGGGGTVSGTPSQVAYFDQDGNLYSDQGFLRYTQSTYIINQTDSILTGLISGRDLNVGVTASALLYVSGPESAYVVVGEINGFSAAAGLFAGGSLNKEVSTTEDSVVINAYEDGGYGGSMEIATQSIRAEIADGDGNKLKSMIISTQSIIIGGHLSTASASYVQTDDFLGLGIPGAGQTFKTSSPGTNVIASVDVTGLGGKQDTTIIGYLDATGAASSKIQIQYDNINDTSRIRIDADTAGGTSSQINISAGDQQGIEFSFQPGGLSYVFPTTNPASGEVMGYISPNTLGWVTPAGGGGGTGSSSGLTYYIQMADGFGGFTSSSNFQYDNLKESFTAKSGTYSGFSSAISGGQQMGNFVAGGNKTIFLVDDISMVIRANTDGVFEIKDSASTHRFLDIDVAGKMFKIGDIDNAYRGLLLDIDNFAGGISLGNIGGATGNNTRINIDDTSKTIAGITDGQFLIKNVSGTSTHLFIDIPSNVAAIGDVSEIGNATKIIIDDNAQQIIGIGKSGVIFGDYLTTGNGTLLTINDSASSIFAVSNTEFSIRNSSSQPWFSALPSTHTVQMGDTGNNFNGTKLTIDDTSNKITATATHINLNLSEYANNAAAVVGGLTHSDLYYTNSAGEGFVKIVI